MNTEKLIKAIQIIVAEEIKVVLPKLVKEGVKKEMAKLLRENKQLKKAITPKQPTFMDNNVEEKPIQISYVNSGIYAINPPAIEHLDVNTFCDMPDFFMDLKSRQYQIMAYPIHETWTDVGRPKDLNDINGSESNS